MEFKFGKPSNGEIQALVKEGLEGIEGISNAQIKTIATSVLNFWDARLADYRTEAQTAVDTVQAQLDGVQKKIDEVTETYNRDQESYRVKYETELPALQKKLDDEITAHTTFRTETENVAKNAAIDKTYTEFLTASGFNPDNIPNELKLANRELLTLDKDGKLKDSDKVLADVKTRWAESNFAEVRENGAVIFNTGGTFARQNTTPQGDNKPNLTAMLFGGGDSND